MLVDGKQRQIVTCSDCGDAFAISSRALRAARAERRPVLCFICRNPAKVRATNVHSAYWLRRMSMDEIRELAELIFGPLGGPVP